MQMVPHSSNPPSAIEAEMVRVSVLMPVFNSAPYLADAVASILHQSYGDFELLIVNDGSTDGSSDILRAFARQDPKVRLIERPNRGLIDTRNQLLHEAQGELLAWMDSDDLSHHDRIGRQVAAFDSDPGLVCLGTNIRLVDPQGRDLGVEEYPDGDEAIREAQMRGGGLRFASTMQRRSVALATGGFRHPFQMGEDFDFLLRVAERGRLGNLHDVLYVYRQHLLNTCTALGISWPETRAAILQLARERFERGTDRLQRGEGIVLPVVKTGDEQRLIPLLLLNWSSGALRAGDRMRAIRYALASIKMSPLRTASWRQLAKLLLVK
jgi:glycosyltransferase involved in cell wall biosynthesis